MKKPLENHEHIVGKSQAISSMVTPIFYDVIIVLSGDILNPIFCITPMIFVNGLPRYLCAGLDFTTTFTN